MGKARILCACVNWNLVLSGCNYTWIGLKLCYSASSVPIACITNHVYTHKYFAHTYRCFVSYIVSACKIVTETSLQFIGNIHPNLTLHQHFTGNSHRASKLRYVIFTEILKRIHMYCGFEIQRNKLLYPKNMVPFGTKIATTSFQLCETCIYILIPNLNLKCYGQLLIFNIMSTVPVYRNRETRYCHIMTEINGDVRKIRPEFDRNHGCIFPIQGKHLSES